jgi:hypothetical protein
MREVLPAHLAQEDVDAAAATYRKSDFEAVDAGLAGADPEALALGDSDGKRAALITAGGMTAVLVDGDVHTLDNEDFALRAMHDSGGKVQLEVWRHKAQELALLTTYDQVMSLADVLPDGHVRWMSPLGPPSTPAPDAGLVPPHRRWRASHPASASAAPARSSSASSVRSSHYRWSWPSSMRGPTVR